MPPKTDRYTTLAADLLKELAAFDATLLDDVGDLAQQETARVKLVADFLRGAFNASTTIARPAVARAAAGR